MVVDRTAGQPVAEVYRTGSGSPLVLLHGANASWRIWGPTLPLLATAHEIYAPTLPGHRGGPAASCGATVEGIADVVEQQLEDAGVVPAHIAGNSFGAAVGLELARRGRARSVVAIAPYGGWRTRLDLEYLLLMMTLSAPTAKVLRLAGPLAHRPWARRQLLRQLMCRADRLPKADYDNILADFDGCTIIRELLAATSRAPTTRAAAPACPIRIAWPQYDRLLPYPRYGEPLRQQMPEAEFIMLPGVGHVPFYDDPELVAAAILAVTQPTDRMTS